MSWLEEQSLLQMVGIADLQDIDMLIWTMLSFTWSYIMDAMFDPGPVLLS